jgi:K+-transporting ATPase ATPase A chain
MEATAIPQVCLFFGLVILSAPLMGRWLAAVMDADGKTWFDKPLKPLERLFLGAQPRAEQSASAYAFSMLAFSIVSAAFTYSLLRLQAFLPLNPQHLPAWSPHLAFDTAISFTTNTNWQSYTPESTASYFIQMVALALHNFLSAAVGIAVAFALVRGIARVKSATVGNFWVDLVRLHLYLLLPACLVFAVFLMGQGMIQNFSPYAVVTGVEGASQTIGMGPVASQVAIKMFGTNGGGFFNANAAHPFENPTALSNFVQMVSIFAVSAGLTWLLGLAVKDKGHGWTLFACMFLMFVGGFAVVWHAEMQGDPRLAALGVDTGPGLMEGKEARFGVMNSALFATVTTDASCGAVNAMHDSLTPLGGLIPMLNIELGEVIFGGVGAGLYGMLVFVILAVFLSGLMVGRTPEYLGKKIGATEVKLAALAVLAPSAAILLFTALACVSPWGLAGLNNGGPHGFSEILYAYSSAAGNNGSAFAGLSANTPQYNASLGIVMWIGRFFVIIPALALAGSLAAKQPVPTSAGSFPVAGMTFGVILTGTVLIVGALTFMPALALGPILEHFLMTGSGRLF